MMILVVMLCPLLLLVVAVICGRGEHLGMDFTIDDYVMAALSIYLDVVNLFL